MADLYPSAIGVFETTRYNFLIRHNPSLVTDFQSDVSATNFFTGILQALTLTCAACADLAPCFWPVSRYQSRRRGACDSPLMPIAIDTRSALSSRPLSKRPTFGHCW
jgi:hypothetical protein